MDISESAVAECKQNYPQGTFLHADFLNSPINEQFDLLFDYTFFCAIQPEMRLRWAAGMRAAVRSGGFLLCLMYPLSGVSGGPPFLVSFEDYEGCLGGEFELQWRSGVDDVPANASRVDRKNRQELSLWRRRID